MKASKKDGGNSNCGRQGQPQDLWPDLSNMAPIRTPFLVLKEQAALLGQKTNNIVTAEVLGPKRGIADQQDDEDFKCGFVVVSFILVAPVLENYHFHLFNIQYSITKPYPARIFAHIQPPLTEKISSEKEPHRGLKDHLFQPRHSLRYQRDACSKHGDGGWRAVNGPVATLVHRLRWRRTKYHFYESLLSFGFRIRQNCERGQIAAPWRLSRRPAPDSCP